MPTLEQQVGITRPKHGWNFIDLTGKKFGDFTVIAFSKRIKKNVFWKCLCKCGREREVRAGNLRSGNSTNCGCGRTKRTPAQRKAYCRQWNQRNLDKVRARSKRWRENNKEKAKETQDRSNLKNKANRRISDLAKKFAAMEMYGGKCLGCGCNELAVLTIDHVNDDGAIDRKSNGNRGIVFYRRLLKQPRRSDLQILCASCQSRKRNYGSEVATWGSKAIRIPL